MTDETVDLTLQRIKRFETRLDSQSEAISEIKHRLSDLETGQAGIMSVLARMQITLDRIDNRLDKIERRLDLASD
jgi:septal ring factor EnvC (AmiA/AmiB activator)